MVPSREKSPGLCPVNPMVAFPGALKFRICTPDCIQRLQYPSITPRTRVFPVPIASSLCEQPFGGLAANMAIFGGPKFPQQREDPGLSLCVLTPKQRGLSEQPAGTVCSSFEQTTGSLSALSTVPGLIIWKEKVWEECCLLRERGWRGNSFVPGFSRRNLALVLPGEETGPPAKWSRSAFP